MIREFLKRQIDILELRGARRRRKTGIPMFGNFGNLGIRI
jgi:hypothetical protein